MAGVISDEYCGSTRGAECMRQCMAVRGNKTRRAAVAMVKEMTPHLHGRVF